MEVKRLDYTDRDVARWDEFVFSRPESNVFQRAGWGRVCERALRRPAHGLYVEDGGEVAGVLPLIHINSPIFGNSLISTGFFVYGGPLAVSDEAHRALDAAAAKLARELGADSVEYRNQQPLRPGWPSKTEAYATFKRAIDPDPEINLMAIKRKQRAVVRKALERDLEIEFGRDVETLYRIMAQSYRNLGTPTFPKALYAGILEEFGEDADILLVRSGGEVVSAVMSFYFRSEVLPYFGGGVPAARGLGANDLMYWRLMDSARERGYTTFDFGRSKVGSGSYAFKKNWGFEPQPLCYEFMLADGADLPDVSPNNPKYRMAVNAWKRLPLPVANVLGPHLVRHLG